MDCLSGVMPVALQSAFDPLNVNQQIRRERSPQTEQLPLTIWLVTNYCYEVLKIRKIYLKNYLPIFIVTIDSG